MNRTFQSPQALAAALRARRQRLRANEASSARDSRRVNEIGVAFVELLVLTLIVAIIVEAAILALGAPH